MYERIIGLLKTGAVGLVPSDTTYGLSCMALNEKAIEKIYKLKGRNYDKPFIILLADADQAVLLGLDLRDLEPARKIWPAPLTLIVPAGKDTPGFLHRGARSLAVRVPENPDLSEVMSRVGPIVSTSANAQGKEPAQTVSQAKKYFGDELDFYVDVGALKTEPSTIAQIKNGKLKIVRQGAFKV